MGTPIVSVHLCDIGASRALSKLATGSRSLRGLPGLRRADLLTAAALGPGLIPRPRPGRLGLVAVWEDEGSLDDFERSHPLAATMAGGFAGRFTVPRAVGAFAGMTPLEDPAGLFEANGGPVGALTYGQLRPGRAPAFLKASARAEGAAVDHPALLFSTGLANPARRIVCTFSMWRDLTGMRDFADGPAHGAAKTVEFHRQSLFARLVPVDLRGSLVA